MTRHSYRRAWADPALKCGNPERFAQQALGQHCEAVHHAFSKNTEITVPSLDDWEKPTTARTLSLTARTP